MAAEEAPTPGSERRRRGTAIGLANLDDDGPGSCLDVGRDVHKRSSSSSSVELTGFDDYGPAPSLDVGGDAHGDSPETVR